MKTFRRKRKSTFGRTVFLVVVVVVIIEIFWHPLRSTFLGSTESLVEKAAYQKSEVTSLFDRIFASKHSLQQEIIDLQEQVLDLQFDNQKSELIRKENEALRDLLDFQESGLLQGGAIAQVIQKPGGAQTDQILVLTQGVEEFVGRTVFFGPYRLGEVSQTSGEIATVDLYSIDPVLKGVLAEEPIDLQSQGSMLFVSQIPKSTEVAVGDVIVLEQFPNDPFVIVTDIVVDEIDPFKTVFSKLPVAFSDISYVTLQ